MKKASKKKGRKPKNNLEQTKKQPRTNYRELISNCAHFSFCQVFMDPWLGTDTSGPGEAAFAIRFKGKPQI